MTWAMMCVDLCISRKQLIELDDIEFKKAQRRRGLKKGSRADGNDVASRQRT
jgi:hypothetical protein